VFPHPSSFGRPTTWIPTVTVRTLDELAMSGA
jgi:hypothetical protein